MVLRRAPGLRHVFLSMTTNLGRTFSKHYEKMLENLSVSWSKMTLTLPESMDEIQDNEARRPWIDEERKEEPSMSPINNEQHENKENENEEEVDVNQDNEAELNSSAGSTLKWTPPNGTRILTPIAPIRLNIRALGASRSRSSRQKSVKTP